MAHEKRMAVADEILEVVEPSAPPAVAVRVWDLPTRLFHWVLVLAVLGSFCTGYLGGGAMAWHLRFGYLAFTLLLFRLLWGFCGGHWSRFRSFAYAPSTSLRYLRGQSRPEERHHVGHTPLGALSVFALLGFLVAQVATGLFADDEIATTGPLNRFVTAKTASLLTHWHKDYGQRIIMVLVLLHVAAILFYLLRLRRNLVVPMVSGDRLLEPGVPPAVDSTRSRLLALALLLGAAAAVIWVVVLGG
jgi:cytochrome b